MKHRYKALLTPLRVGDVVIRTRFGMSKCNSQEQQGPENFPAEGTIKFVEEAARNGASIVTMPSVSLTELDREIWKDAALFPVNNAFVNNYFVRLFDRIHAYGSLCSAQVSKRLPDELTFSEQKPRGGPGGPGGPGMGGFPKQGLYIGEEKVRDGLSNRGTGGGFMMYNGPKTVATTEQIEAVIYEIALDASELRSLGFDMVSVGSLGDTSADRNTRTDKYGGSFENRIRATTEMLAKIRELCGPNFPIEMMVQASDDPEAVEMMKVWAEYVDIYHIRPGGMVGSHPDSYVFDENNPLALDFAAKCKAAGVNAIIAPACGFQDPDIMEKALEDGKCDMFYMARPFNCDPDYLEKIIEQRGEDVIPCLRCDNCHSAICAVNPRFGLENVYPNMFKASKGGKSVAVIGGGPAGMRAALTCAERGHSVTLFEKESYLGGQAVHSDYVGGKWAMKRFKDWLIDQITKAGVDIKLNTIATPEMIEEGEYDAVFAATGAVPVRQSFPGAENAPHPMEVFGREQDYGKRVVIVGGSISGLECAIYLSETGHDVTIISREMVGHGLQSHSSMEIAMMIVRQHPAINAVSFANIVSAENGVAIYTDRDGNEHSAEFDSLIVNGGVKPCVDEANKFFGTAPQYYIIGDADVTFYKTMGMTELFAAPDKMITGNMRKANFTAFMAANNI